MEQDLISGLMQRGIPEHIAKGIVANMVAESGLNPGINEQNPTVAGSRGGYGLNQWTGPRRVQFEQFARDRGVSPSDPGAQLDFTVWELQNTERNAWGALQGAQTPADAARIYSDTFLRPGIPHMDARIAEANRLAGITAGPQGPQTAPQGPQNALAAQPAPFQWNTNQIDAAAFQRPVNQLAQLRSFRGQNGA